MNAPAEEVWGLFIDVERWPMMIESHESVRRLDCGPLQVGSDAIVKQPRLPQARWKVTQLQSGRCFVWETASPGVTSAGGHLVEPHGQGAMITLTLRQHGPLARLAQVLLGRRIRRYLSNAGAGRRDTLEISAGQEACEGELTPTDLKAGARVPPSAPREAPVAALPGSATPD